MSVYQETFRHLDKFPIKISVQNKDYNIIDIILNFKKGE